jgi:DNA-binding NarL/FixJ family response regulator
VQAWYTVVSFGRLLGEAAAMLGRPDEARTYFQQALDVCVKVRFRPEIALIRLDLAELLSNSAAEDRAQAFEHLQFVAAEFEDMHMQPSLERARRLSHRLAEAQSGRPPGSSQASQRATDAYPVEALTARERELAGFIARGLSNRDIAAAMVISEGTTEVHVKHILSKLGFRSRAQVAVWAVEHGLSHEGDVQR